MAKGIVQKVKDRVAYERESYRLSQKHMVQVFKESPELSRKPKR